MSTVTFRGNNLTSPLIVKGSGGRRQPDGTVTTDLTFAMLDSALLSNIPTRGVTPHPYLPGFLCDDFTWEKPFKQIVLMKVSYIALLTASQITSTSLPPDVEAECGSVAQEEPVATLMNFLKPYASLPAMAAPTTGAWPTDTAGNVLTVDPATGAFPSVNGPGKVGPPLTISNGAIFDTFGQNNDPTKPATFNPQVGRFLYFAPGSKYVGLESVLIPRGEYRYTYATNTVPNLSGVGQTGTPPGAPALNPAANYNWLCVSKAWRKTGIIYHVTTTWRVSGPRGWNPDIYPKQSSSAQP